MILVYSVQQVLLCHPRPFPFPLSPPDRLLFSNSSTLSHIHTRNDFLMSRSSLWYFQRIRMCRNERERLQPFVLSKPWCCCLCPRKGQVVRFRRPWGFASRQRKVKCHASLLLLLLPLLLPPLLLRERWAAALWLRAGATHRWADRGKEINAAE